MLIFTIPEKKEKSTSTELLDVLQLLQLHAIVKNLNLKLTDYFIKSIFNTAKNIPNENIGYIKNFLYMMDKNDSDKDFRVHPKMVRAIKILLILHAVHVLMVQTRLFVVCFNRFEMLSISPFHLGR